MQTLFELQTEHPFDAALFECMRQRACDLLQNTEKEQYTQVLVMCSSTGKEYSAVIKNALTQEMAEEKALLEKLKADDGAPLCYVLCMWQDFHIDIPSMALRKMLCAINPQNADALLFVMTKSGVSAIKLANTMK